MDRRSFLKAGIIGCSAAASPLFTPVSFASAPWENRLVVIILRGGMDGLDVVQPHGAPEFAALRGAMPVPGVGAAGGAIDLDGFFALHPALGSLMPLWGAGELGFVHAVSTPYRNKRSHFDGQDVLEAGTPGADAPVRDGWLNRLLQVSAGVEAETAYAVGRADMLLTRGAAPVANWSPDAAIGGVSPQALRLIERVMHDDPLFAETYAEALELSGEGRMADAAGMAEEVEPDMAMMQAGMQERARAGGHIGIARYAGERLRGDTRIAAFSANGWDTHAGQHVSLSRPLNRLAETILTLKEAAGPAVWSRTAVVAMTEFGRTARLNGTRGTDHGTGGAMVLAGGAVRGGKVYGRWPGLEEAELFDRRDLMPTGDVRAQAAWVMRGLFGVERGVLEAQVFPGLEMGPDPGILR